MAVIFKIKGFSFTRKIVKFTALDGFADAFLGNLIDDVKEVAHNSPR